MHDYWLPSTRVMGELLADIRDYRLNEANVEIVEPSFDRARALKRLDAARVAIEHASPGYALLDRLDAAGNGSQLESMALYSGLDRAAFDASNWLPLRALAVREKVLRRLPAR